MSDRDSYVSSRITDSQYESLKTAAQAQALTVAEWLRLAVLRRISGDDSTTAGLVRDVLATRILLLNLLYYLGPDGSKLGREGLKKAQQRARDSSQTQVQKLLSLDPDGQEPQDKEGRLHGQPVKARLTEAHYDTVTLAAASAGTTVSEWLRQAVLTDLERQTVLQILKDQVLALRLILEESVTTLLTEGGQLDRNALAALTKRTDPVPAGRNTSQPSRGEDSTQQD